MPNITPYLFFNGNCREALSFYHQVFGGKLEILTHADVPGQQAPQDRQSDVMHGCLSGGSFILMASDSPDRSANTGSSVQMSINCESLEEIDRLFGQLSEKGLVGQPLEDAFWGDRFGTLTDRFGMRWMLNAPLKK